MACLAPAVIANFLIWLVIVVAVVAILNLVVPWVLAQLGTSPDGGIIAAVLRIIMWAVVAIALIYFIVGLIGCIGLPRL